VCVANLTVTGKDAQFQVFGGAGSQTFINADNIAAGTITANEIAANTITSNNILAGTIQASKIDVTNLFAQNITATGIITGATLQTATSGARSEMASNGFLGRDSSGVVRIQLANAATPTLAFFKSSGSSVSAL
jgi:hypothetical protein